MVPMGSSSMVYTINQKVITLKEYGLDNFWTELKRIREENKLYDRRNIEWFDILPETFMTYPEWFFLFDNDEPVAFSTIQPFGSDTYRLLTRTYIYRNYRRFTNPKVDKFNSPTMRILPYQLEYIKGYKSAFVSMQSLSRRPAIERFAKKLEYRTEKEWKLADNMLLTCTDDYGKDCWQSIIYNGEKPLLPEISIEEWKKRYG
jgi:hypothetical protein